GPAVRGAPPWPDVDRRPADAPLPPLVISARTEASLRELAQSWHQAVAASPAERVPSIVRAAARCRDHHPERLVVLGADQAQLVAALGESVTDETRNVVAGSALR